MKFEKKDILLIAASIVVLAIMMTINVTIGVDPLTMQVAQNHVEAKAAEPVPEQELTITPTKEPPQIIDDPIEEEPEEEEIDISSLQRVRCTCYTPTGNATASGIMPYEGICASNHEHMGWTARIYTLEGELIGVSSLYFSTPFAPFSASPATLYPFFVRISLIIIRINAASSQIRILFAIVSISCFFIL